MDNIYIERLWINLKLEDIYLNDYISILNLKHDVRKYFLFYSTRRFHQSVDYQTPDHVYFFRAAKNGVNSPFPPSPEGRR
ncbi:MAG: transposase [Pseudodesulfovibrio sp.]|nr:transposase [Pseudodesulfovibrio sp.]